ncbi:YhgE/Pip family protein [Vagococcus sp. JNUCC 83]
MIKQEFKQLFHNKILLISVIAICFIPILYSSVFDKSVWDPYNRSSHLPVAVVNEDQPVDMLGQKVDVGKSVIDELKHNKQLKWEFVDAKEAMNGMKDLKYYMIVTIPKDFSKNAASLLDPTPNQMEIEYTTNGSLNYIGLDMAQIGAKELEAKVRESVTASYVKTVLSIGQKGKQDLVKLTNGSKELAKGSTQLDNGLSEYTNGVSTAASGSETLTNGINKLASNVSPLKDGVTELQEGSNKLSNGLNQVNEKIQPLSGKLNEVGSGVTDLLNGTKELEVSLKNVEGSLSGSSSSLLKQDIEKINQQVESVLNDSKQLSEASSISETLSTDLVGLSNQLSGFSQVIGSINQTVSQDTQQFEQLLEGIIQQNSRISDDVKQELITQLSQQVTSFSTQLSSDISKSSSDIDSIVNQVQTGLNDASEHAKTLSQQATMISQIAKGLSENTGEMKESISNIKAGTTDLLESFGNNVNLTNTQNVLHDLETGLSQVDNLVNDAPVALNGINRLSAGSDALTSGLNTMSEKMPELVSGVSQLDNGSTELSQGLNQLTNNTPKLMNGASQLTTGATTMATALTQADKVVSRLKFNNKNVNMFAAPTGLKNIEYSKVKNYGQALAPYIMSLALFVGCIVFNFIFPIRRVSMKGQSSRDWWLSKVAIGFVVATIMAVIEATIMLLLKLPVDQVGKLYLVGIVTAWCYMFLIMFLAMTFDNPGRFVAMILLVLQLGGAGGTFPLPLQNSFFNAIHPYLPMTYSVYGFREAISRGIGAPVFNKSIMTLLCLFIVFVMLLRFSMDYLQRKHLENISALNDNQKLQALEK